MQLMHARILFFFHSVQYNSIQSILGINHMNNAETYSFSYLVHSEAFTVYCMMRLIFLNYDGIFKAFSIFACLLNITACRENCIIHTF